LTAASAFLWAGSLLYVAILLASNPVSDLFHLDTSAGMILAVLNTHAARRAASSPIVLGGLLLFAVFCAWMERKMKNPPEFPLGLLVGIFCVLLTTCLSGLVLLLDGADRWHTFVEIIFLAHLPLALLEGLVLGSAVSFLARVKPGLLAPKTTFASKASPSTTSLLFFLALVSILFMPGTAWAHRMKARANANPIDNQVKVECLFETKEIPQMAKVKVLRENGSVLKEGMLDEKGHFAFHYEKPELLRIVINAPGGHRAECLVTAAEMGLATMVSSPEMEQGPLANQSNETNSRSQNILLGITFILALASFLLTLRNGRLISNLKRVLDGRQPPRN
jgi:hypothetical protein